MRLGTSVAWRLRVACAGGAATADREAVMLFRNGNEWRHPPLAYARRSEEGGGVGEEEEERRAAERRGAEETK